jgi:hypothetical protein
VKTELEMGHAPILLLEHPVIPSNMKLVAAAPAPSTPNRFRNSRRPSSPA